MVGMPAGFEFAIHWRRVRAVIAASKSGAVLQELLLQPGEGAGSHLPWVPPLAPAVCGHLHALEAIQDAVFPTTAAIYSPKRTCKPLKPCEHACCRAAHRPLLFRLLPRLF